MGWSADWVPCVWYFGWFLFLGIIVYPVFFVWIVKPSLSSSLKSCFISLLLCCFGMLCFSFWGGFLFGFGYCVWFWVSNFTGLYVFFCCFWCFWLLCVVFFD